MLLFVNEGLVLIGSFKNEGPRSVLIPSLIAGYDNTYSSRCGWGKFDFTAV